MNIQHAYNDWSQSYDINENLTRDLDQMVTRETLGGHRYNSILEIGCGTGKNTAFLVQAGDRVHALDFSQGMIEKAREKVQAGNVRFETADITKPWPCDNEAYDLITCNLVLEHTENLTHIFSEAARTLVPNGRFLINELHPFRQYQGTKARFEKEGLPIEVDAFVHHISEFINTATACGLDLFSLNEFWHEADRDKPPRLVSFIFEKP
ncbi:MAG TPA: class I SAM-dependent methyltransferase [Anaerolineales bacterium]|nr:class I SAM-dependent methyltransferase [Anaerolineales bacterium]